MKPNRTLSLADRRRVLALILLGVVVMAMLAIKSFNDGWFEPKIPLELNDQPALVFLMLRRGCECQMSVVRAAEAQLATWQVAQKEAIPILWVDFSRRPDLARQYGVARAPALVLLNAAGEVVWKQDVGLSDDSPLDLVLAQSQVEMLLPSETK